MSPALKLPTLALGSISCVGASLASAQQFRIQPALLPGPARWSEAVAAADVDHDGDLDLFVADGEGFDAPGAPRQNVLLLNRRIESGSLAFVDASVPRLGTSLSHAKDVQTADVDGDGWIDALFVNAFGTAPHHLFMNRGALGPGQAGHFAQEGQMRGLNLVFDARAAAFGDLDDDGDLDLVLTDSGPSFPGAPGGRPRLFLNDGLGHFGEVQGSRWAPPVKEAQVEVRIVDVDGDFDLDVLIVSRAANAGGMHTLLLNDGAGHFSDASALVPDSSAGVEALEAADLDGDSDLDLCLANVSTLADGILRAELVPSGTLGFTPLAPLPLAEESGALALLDFDGDGWLDLLAGSRGAQERLWRNEGGLAFSAAHASIEALDDPTLGLELADLDGDGTYDFVSAQGGGNDPARWTNQAYLNAGPPDLLAPRIASVRALGLLETSSGPWLAHAKVRDEVVAGGLRHVRGWARSVVNPLPLRASVRITDAGFDAASVAPGTLVTWVNASSSVQSVTSNAAPYLWDSGSLPPGASFERYFVAPGTYAYTSLPSGFAGTLDVVGAASDTTAFFQGGDQFRFALDGDASSSSAELVYELHFVDGAGNERAGEPRAARRLAPAGTPYCAGDGSGAFCPCFNFGLPGRGCGNGTFQDGALLEGFGDASVGTDTLVLRATLSTLAQPGLFFQGDNEINAGSGAGFGDGLRCAGGFVVRLQTLVSDPSGTAQSSVPIAARAGLLPGQTKRYQWWYRDPLASPCGTQFNLTNGLRVTWGP